MIIKKRILLIFLLYIYHIYAILQAYNIGVILPFTSNQYKKSCDDWIAIMEYARDNHIGILGEVNLVFVDSGTSNEEAIYACKKATNVRTIGFIGEISSGTEEYIYNNYIYQTKLPIVGFTITSNVFSDNSIYPNLFRVIPSNDAFAEGMILLTQHLGITKVGVIYTYDSYGQSGLNSLKKYAPGNVEIVESRRPYNITESLIEYKSEGINNFLLFVLPSTAIETFHDACKLDMLNSRTRWIGCDGMALIHDSQIDPECLGRIEDTNVYCVEPRESKNISKILNKNETDVAGMTSYAYESVSLFLEALEIAQKTYADPFNLTPIMQKIQYDGVTGPVSFDPTTKDRLGVLDIRYWDPLPSSPLMVGNISMIGSYELEILLDLPEVNKSLVLPIVLSTVSFLLLIVIVFIILFILIILLNWRYNEVQKKINDIELDTVTETEVSIFINQADLDLFFPPIKVTDNVVSNYASYKGIQAVVRTVSSEAHVSKEKFIEKLHFLMFHQHPNIIAFLGGSVTPYSFIYERAAKGSLYDLVHRKHSKFTLVRRLNIVLDALKGLLFLHNSVPGVIHKNVKSRNILVNDHYVGKLTDFDVGFTVNLSANTNDMESIRWMSPEMLEHVISQIGVTNVTDVYSIGIILWEVYTGEIPFEGMNKEEAIASIRFGKRPEFPLDVDPIYEDLTFSCWDASIAARPDAEKVIIALSGIIEKL